MHVSLDQLDRYQIRCFFLLLSSFPALSLSLFVARSSHPLGINSAEISKMAYLIIEWNTTGDERFQLIEKYDCNVVD